MTAALPAMAGDREYDKRFENNCQMKTTDFCKGAGQTLSKRHKWLPMVAHGGNDKLYSSARRVAMCLNNSGIRAYIVHGPDNDMSDRSMFVDFYTKGGTATDLSVFDNKKNPIDEVDNFMAKTAITAFEKDYGKVSLDQDTLDHCLTALRSPTYALR